MEIIEALKFLTAGALLGLTSGISPGPLLTLVISETIRHNRREGIKVALSPLITDIPIILLSFFVFYKLSGFDMIIGMISIAGGIFIAYLGCEALKMKGSDTVLPLFLPFACWFKNCNCNDCREVEKLHGNQVI